MSDTTNNKQRRWRKVGGPEVQQQQQQQQQNTVLAKNAELLQERRRLLALVAECDEALKSVPWYTACATARNIVAIFSCPDGPLNGEPLFQLDRKHFNTKWMGDLLDKLTGPQGRVVPLSEITDTGSWCAGTRIWEDASDYDYSGGNVVVYRSDEVAGEYVVSYDQGWHFRLSHENLVDLLEDLIACFPATKEEGSK